MLVHAVLNRNEYASPQLIKNDVDEFQKILQSSGSSLTDSRISILWGPLGRRHTSSRLAHFINFIREYQPSEIVLDSTTTRHSSRGIYVDTHTGEVFKQNGSPSIWGDTGPIEQLSGNIDRLSWGTPLRP